VAEVVVGAGGGGGVTIITSSVTFGFGGRPGPRLPSRNISVYVGTPQ
jgi:hypothetical protein